MLGLYFKPSATQHIENTKISFGDRHLGLFVGGVLSLLLLGWLWSEKTSDDAIAVPNVASPHHHHHPELGPMNTG
eukprot:339883-Amphidinium_carterae.1